MQTVEFTVVKCGADRYHYECSALGDHSGVYVSAEGIADAAEVVKTLMRAHSSGGAKDIGIAFHNARNFLVRVEKVNGPAG